MPSPRARGRFAPYLLGAGLLGLGALAALFAAWAALVGEQWKGFGLVTLTAVPVGLALVSIGRANVGPSRREALIGVLLLWLLIPVVGAIPYAVSGVMSALDALFESMSGFTATGATVLRDFTTVPSTLFMWRALSQWFGGVGIVVLFVAVFPQLAIAGRQLFFTEMPGPTEERLTPRLRNTAGAVLLVYFGLTVTCALAYLLGGMSPFDALAHAFTTIGAGGFSHYDLSFQAFDSAVLDWIAIFFMLFSGTSFALLYRALGGRPRDLLQDAEFRAYLGIIVTAGAALSIFLASRYDGVDALRHGLFQTVSILTTTGYASVDFAAWGPRAQMVLLVLMFIGGSAGSAAGGVKVMRWLIIMRNTSQEVQRTLHPRGVFPVRVGNRVVPEDVLSAVGGFITLYVALIAASTVVLVAFGTDFVTAFTASVAAVGNVGPGLAAVGPMANFADLHPVSRSVLIFDMYAGRLEVVTVFVIFTRRWWHLPRRHEAARS